MSILFMCAMQYLNTPYKWSANGPFEYDCSGFVLQSMRDYLVVTGRKEVAQEIPDMTSQGIYNWLIKSQLKCSPPDEDSILFYGKSLSKITHIAIAGSRGMLIEAAGSGRVTENLTGDELIKHCKKHDARVRYRNIGHRIDLVASIKFDF